KRRVLQRLRRSKKPLTDSNRRPPLCEGGPWVKRVCIAWLWRLVWLLVVSGAHLSIASWWEDKADWSSLRWRSSLRAVRRPGGRWRRRLWERGAAGGGACA